MNKSIALAALLALGLFHASARAQDLPYSVRSQTFTNAVAHNTTVTIQGPAIRLRGNNGIALLPQFNGTNGSATNAVTFRFAVSADGTNWSTTTPISYIVNSSGTNTVRGWTNVPSATLDNTRYMRLESVSVDNTSTNSITNISLVNSTFSK